MRIISGNKRGKKILLPNPKITRPLKDNVKENIFNILLHTKHFKTELEGSNIIDFFSGSGSFGLECLSRGSKKVAFLEKNAETRNTLFRNLSNNFEKNKFQILKDNFFLYDKLNLIIKYNPKIIFIDPPYKIENFEHICNFINTLIKFKEILIILHIEKTRHVYFDNFKHKLEKTYGTSKIVFLKN